MTKWIDIQKQPPPDGIIWVLIKGRMECDGQRDTIIEKMIHNTCNGEFPFGELRSLDYGSAIYLNSKIIFSDFDNVIAWMPLEKMDFPDWIKEKLK